MKNIFLLLLISFVANAQEFIPGSYSKSKFHQMEETWPTPNESRTGSGSPGSKYWQQQVNYKINVSLDENNQTINGSEIITYINNSPDALTYLWLQLDQNIFDPNSDSYSTETRDKLENMNIEAAQFLFRNKFKGGYEIKSVKDLKGQKINYTINKTMMRVDLPTPLKSGGAFTFSVDWFNNINNSKINGGRGGYELFEDGNIIFEMAQWFPRLAVYDDVDGWQTKAYLGSGEFALEFGDYEVNITVPADHIVAATGELSNSNEVLTSTQKNNFEKAKTSEKPFIIVSQSEAEKKEGKKNNKTKTWKFVAKNVRDFAWASSRKFIWDAMNVKIGNKNVMAMSFYPKEANPLWEKYSTHSIAHTLEVYSRYTVNYPYPVAISVNGPIGGMEYPMICFNGPRPEKDGTYSDRTKYGLISVVIHEVGHNFFPMIINSDERQWTWMDEGLNTFCEYLAEKEWEQNYPARRGEPADIVNYMSSDKSLLEPIMTNSESVLQLGNNAYGKTATALNILRETIMGRELFDFAFKNYAEKWAFKHPMPADFFRTMEDASGVDLDWFWRGWFYSTDPCDIAINNVKWITLDSQNPEIEKPLSKKKLEEKELSLSKQRDKTAIPKTRVDKFQELADFYNSYDPLSVTDMDKQKYADYQASLSEKDKETIQQMQNFYLVEFENKGGLIMPLIVKMIFADGEEEVQRIPAEIWRKNNSKVSKLFITQKEVKQFVLDPYLETADIDLSNNYFPEKIMESKFQLMKQQAKKSPNLMQLDRDKKL